MNGSDEQNPAATRVDIALVHYPVINKNGERIGAAITNLDLHDIARAAKTFGVTNLYVVTPFQDQQDLYQEILEHWLKGHGARYNAKRGQALSLVHMCNDLAELYDLAETQWQQRPFVIATGARPQGGILPYEQVREKIGEGSSILILFGTAWGLAPEVMEQVDGILPPICGPGEYNHLSVRSAAAIVLDRLLGKRDE